MPFPNTKNIEIRLPKGIVFTPAQMFEFCEINDIKRVETDFENGFFTLIIKPMNTFKAALFTAQLLGAMISWNKTKKLGVVSAETAAFAVAELVWREADTSFVSFEKLGKELQSFLNGICLVLPTLLFEVSSTHLNAKKDLAKTQKYWMPAGTDYAVIIDLEKKEWHFFNRSTVYSTHHFSEKFIAPADLPNLEIDFEAIINEIGV